MKLAETQRKAYFPMDEKWDVGLFLEYEMPEVRTEREFMSWLKEKDRTVDDFSVEVTYRVQLGNSHDEMTVFHYDVWKENTVCEKMLQEKCSKGSNFSYSCASKPLSEEEIDKLFRCEQAYCVFRGTLIWIYIESNKMTIKAALKDNINVIDLESQLGLNDIADSNLQSPVTVV